MIKILFWKKISFLMLFIVYLKVIYTYFLKISHHLITINFVLGTFISIVLSFDFNQ